MGSTDCLFTAVVILFEMVVVCCPANIARGGDVAYITGNLTGCVRVKGEPTCRVDYPVPDYFARQYHDSLEIIKFLLPDEKKTSRSCWEMFRKLLCGQRFPRCISNSRFDFGNVSLLCAQLMRACSKSKDFFVRSMGLNYCKLTQGGSFKSDTCVDISMTTKLGNCTKNLKKVPIWIADRYRGVKQINTKIPNPTTTNCKRHVQEEACKIPFCSSNGKFILNLYTKQKCMAMTKCIIGNSTFTGKTSLMICNSYPDENKAKKVQVV